MLNLLQSLINGVSVGGLYALIALGYSLVFSILKFVNFAHGDLFMLGAYLVMSLGLLALPLPLALTFGMFGCGLISVFIAKRVYQPLEKQDRLTLLISAVAVSLLLENGVQLFYRAEARSFPFAFNDDIILIGEALVVRHIDILIVSVTAALAICNWVLISKTRIGMAIRAVASNRTAALISGLPVDRIVTTTFFIGAVLATVAGVLQSLTTNQLTPLMGVAAGLKAFAAAVLGGIGSLWGAVFGGLFLGLLESVVIGLGYSEWKDCIAFILLILILLIRPQGLLGQKETVKI